MADETRIEREFSWDDEIFNDSPEWILLEPGEYEFEVTGFERKRFDGSAKLPPCNMAELKIRIDSPIGSTTINHRLYLHTKTEGLLCAFFTAIGHRKSGEPLRMDWGRVIGSTGRCKVSIHDYTNKKGEAAQSNQITQFLEPAEPAKAFTPGKF